MVLCYNNRKYKSNRGGNIMSGKVVIFNHPLIHHKLSLIRNENTNTKDFDKQFPKLAA